MNSHRQTAIEFVRAFYEAEIRSGRTNTNQAVKEFEVSVRRMSEILENIEPARDFIGPAVPIEQSVSPDKIICLYCGKEVRTIKRHLKSAHGVTPEQYRERWELDENYPMACSNFKEDRAKMARKTGLGKHRIRAK